jgi:hypothetical protein
MNGDLERYLRQATRGLWGKKRLEVREELSTHILERARKHELEGASREAAIQLAIAELGDARTIRAGMIGVHTMPKALTGAGLMSIAAVGVAVLLSVSSAQVTGTTRLPIAQCANTTAGVIEVNTPSGRINKFSCDDAGVWLNYQSLRATLEPLGVTFTEMRSETPGLERRLLISFPEGRVVAIYVQTHLRLSFPNTSKPERIELSAQFISASDFVIGISQPYGSFTMAGWDNPVMRIGQIRFQVGSSSAPVRGEDWYPSVLQLEFPKLFDGWFSESVQPDSLNMMEREAQMFGTPLMYRTHLHRIQTDFAAGQILVVASREEAHTVTRGGKSVVLPAFIRTYIAPIGKDGVLTYPSDAKTLRFVDNVRDLKQTFKDGAGSVIVLKFTSQLAYDKIPFTIVSSSRLSK